MHGAGGDGGGADGGSGAGGGVDGGGDDGEGGGFDGAHGSLGDRRPRHHRRLLCRVGRPLRELRRRLELLRPPQLARLPVELRLFLILLGVAAVIVALSRRAAWRVAFDVEDVLAGVELAPPVVVQAAAVLAHAGTFHQARRTVGHDEALRHRAGAAAATFDPGFATGLGRVADLRQECPADGRR